MPRIEFSESWRLPPTAEWLPRFCHLPTVLAGMVLAQLVVCIAVLSPGSTGTAIGQALSVGTAFGQWIALTLVAGLCVLHGSLLRMPPPLALAVTLLAVFLGAHSMAWIALSVERGLELGLIGASVDPWPFAAGCGAIALLIVAAGLRYHYVHEQWKRRVEAQARVEVEALTARIRPHFLFNSMNTIASLVHEDPELAEQVTLDLADLFRSALEAGESAHPLSRELELCRRYLAIEELRLGRRLKVEWDVAAAPGELSVPPLILQPLVENAVYHGIQALREGGRVLVRARREGGRLHLRVENPCPDPPQARRGGHGMALDNVRRRLQLAFGAGAGLDIEHRPGCYAASLHIPLLTESRP